jgi:hypothetical protein
MQYSDPDNTPELLTRLSLLPTIKDVKQFIEEIFPNWIITAIDSYSEDYSHLEKNWKVMANMSGVNPAQILIVEDIVFDNCHTLIRNFAELLTRAGFMVRRKNEFFPCPVCNKAIPSENLYNKMKEKKFPIPDIWKSKCSNC